MASTARRNNFAQVEISIEVWTPEDAAMALKKSRVNRSFRPYTAEKYAADMSEGNWGIAESAIAFDTRGYLVNGYHRLTAQTMSQKSVTWAVMRNVPLGAQDLFDQGTPRNLADVLTYMGINNPQLAGAVLKLVANIQDNGMTRARSKLSTQQLLTVLNDNPEIKTAVDVATAFRRDAVTPIFPSVIGAAHWMISQVNGVNDATDFIDRLAHLTGEQPGSSVLALSRRINEAKRNRVRLHQRDLLAAVIKAYNYDVDGKPIIKISIFPKSTKMADFEIPEVHQR